MTAGVPGTGIGGLYYVVAAIVLPLRGLVRRMRGFRVPWREVLGPAALGAGVLIGIWATGWLLGFLLAPAAETLEAAAGKTSVFGLGASENIVRWAALAAGFATLALVLLTVQILRFTAKRK
jgi:hypothetical protein